MKHLGRTIFALAALAALAAIWTPIGTWWQWGITALILVFVGAGVLGQDGRDEEGKP